MNFFYEQSAGLLRKAFLSDENNDAYEKIIKEVDKHTEAEKTEALKRAILLGMVQDQYIDFLQADNDQSSHALEDATDEEGVTVEISLEQQAMLASLGYQIAKLDREDLEETAKRWAVQICAMRNIIKSQSS